MDPIQEVHDPWKELKRGSNITWEPGPENQYTSPSGGPLDGPSQKIVRLAGNAESLA